MTFFDLAEGGGAETGSERAGGTGDGGRLSAVVTRVRDAGAG